MNSYQTLNAAAHISGIPVRYAVAFGQAYHAGHYRPAESLGELVRRDMIASYRAFADTFEAKERVYANAPRVDHDPVGRWNAEEKERQLKLRQYAENDVKAVRQLKATIPRRDYGMKPRPRFVVVYHENIGDDWDHSPWKIYDTKVNPKMTGTSGRWSYHTAAEAAEYLPRIDVDNA